MIVIEEYPCIQGEGQFIGVPSYMIRTNGCNLRCAWKEGGKITICDTPYSSYNLEKGKKLNMEKTLKLLKNKYPHIKHIIITGGEPTLQNDLSEVIRFFALNKYTITVETNGTNFFDANNVDLISISPKLKNSYNQKKESHNKIHIEGNKELYNIVKKTIEKSNTNFIQLKFVVNEKKDLKEIDEFVDYVNCPKRRVWLMPQGITKKQTNEKEKWLVRECIKRGYNLTTRMHINIYGNKRGV